MAGIYDISLRTLQGQPLPLAAYRGRPLLIVNTASRCGFTPQYAGLETLWRDHRAAGLTVIGVPCNDFGGQEPGEAAAIGDFCEATYGVSFPLTEKLHSKGPQRHPLFAWLAAEGGFLSLPRWNFYKYLIDGEGRLATWFTSVTKPDSAKVVRAVERALRTSDAG